MGVFRFQNRRTTILVTAAILFAVGLSLLYWILAVSEHHYDRAAEHQLAAATRTKVQMLQEALNSGGTPKLAAVLEILLRSKPQKAQAKFLPYPLPPADSAWADPRALEVAQRAARSGRQSNLAIRYQNRWISAMPVVGPERQTVGVFLEDQVLTTSAQEIGSLRARLGNFLPVLALASLGLAMLFSFRSEELASTSPRFSTLARGIDRIGLLELILLLGLILATGSLSQSAAMLQSEEGVTRGYWQIVVSGLVLLVACGAAALIFLRAALIRELHLVHTVQSLNHSKCLYARMAESLPAGFMRLEGDTIAMANSTWFHAFGQSSGAGVDAFLDSILQADQDRVANELEHCRTAGVPVTTTFRTKSAGNGQRHFALRLIPSLDDNGQCEHVLAFVFDTSEEVLKGRELSEKHQELSDKSQMLQKAYSEIEQSFEAMVYSLVKAVEMKDPYTAGHSERVMRYSMMIGRRLGLDEKQLRILQMGALVHDAGKIGVPDQVLLKPEDLTDEEFEIVKRHTTMGADIVVAIPIFQPCVDIVRHHHERLDGSGYPDGLVGDQISQLVRIVAVADVYDAITTNRAYRQGRTVEVALAELRNEAERNALDSELVKIFAEEIISEMGRPILRLEAAA